MCLCYTSLLYCDITWHLCLSRFTYLAVVLQPRNNYWELFHVASNTSLVKCSGRVRQCRWPAKMQGPPFMPHAQLWQDTPPQTLLTFCGAKVKMSLQRHYTVKTTVIVTFDGQRPPLQVDNHCIQEKPKNFPIASVFVATGVPGMQNTVMWVWMPISKHLGKGCIAPMLLY